jgi:hypothetical protein
MSSPLLSLPGELKNMIFKSALSESDGVDFVEDESGNGRLCLHARDRDVTSIVTHDTAMYTVKGGRVIANHSLSVASCAMRRRPLEFYTTLSLSLARTWTRQSY